MDGARARRGEADPDLAGVLGMSAGHESGHFLVPDLDEVHLVLRPVKRADQTVDAVAREAEHAPYTPLPEPLPEEVANRLGHNFLLPRSDLRAAFAR
jgi:hypothetical protein